MHTCETAKIKSPTIADASDYAEQQNSYRLLVGGVSWYNHPGK